MSVTQIPPRDPQAPPPPPAEQRDLFEAQHWESAYRSFNPDHVPHLLIQLQDDLARSRKREALWLSVVLHLLVVVLLANTEKIMSFLPHRALLLPAAIDLEKQKDATYLELPPDEQKLTRRPDSKIISDKDRIATSKAPQINRDELRRLLESSRPGRPEPAGPAPGSPPPETAQTQAPAQPPPPQQSQQPDQGSGFSKPADNSQIAQLRAPAAGQARPHPSFSTPTSAGSAIEQAARAAAANRGYYGGGDSGDYGLSPGQNGAKALGQAEILTDTMGVDFGPYLARVLQAVRSNWYHVLPESVTDPTIRKQGKLSIEFVILKDGKVSGMVYHESSGDVALDRAAWASINLSNPFPPLPKEFAGQYLGLRFYYFYNLDPVGIR